MGDKRGAKGDELHLTPRELIERIAALVALALAQPATAQTGQTGTGEGVPGVVPVGKTVQTQPEPVPPKRSPAHYLWAACRVAVLLAMTFLSDEVCPLLWDERDAQMCEGRVNW